PRGNWLDDSGAIVEPAVPAFLGRLDVGARRADRLDLARWLTDTEQGIGLLTARVYVNRVWALFFGGGLCPSLDDFGGQGQPVHHPELLDRLACEFVASGWDVKSLVRTIVTTNTYRQASTTSPAQVASDPQNVLLSRQTKSRLQAEFVRDNALAVSGLLNSEIGGPSIKPYQPAGYYRHLNFPPRTYHADEDAQQWRRGVYMHWQRQFLHPMLRAFDAPTREECAASRPRSNTPLAALTMLNDPTFVEAAVALAARALADVDTQSDQDRVTRLYQLALSRAPDAYEMARLSALLQRTRSYYAAHAAAAVELTHAGQFAPPPMIAADELAAWTTVARAVMNLHEFISRD
ncbi:MAG: DUF1553 domain-containing protein, partial [Planctomycetales bacterium]|nr:DUF1553 domain-containing protein [Planctomycetales bacterium]